MFIVTMAIIVVSAKTLLPYCYAMLSLIASLDGTTLRNAEKRRSKRERA